MNFRTYHIKVIENGKIKKEVEINQEGLEKKIEKLLMEVPRFERFHIDTSFDDIKRIVTIMMYRINMQSNFQLLIFEEDKFKYFFNDEEKKF
jgi:hypothetical protein